MAHAIETSTGWIPTDTFAARLATLRVELGGLNISAAARKCGIGEESWRQWEKGVQPHNQEAAADKIAAATGCDYRWLMVGGPLKSSGTSLTPLHKTRTRWLHSVVDGDA